MGGTSRHKRHQIVISPVQSKREREREEGEGEEEKIGLGMRRQSFEAIRKVLSIRFHWLIFVDQATRNAEPKKQK